MKILTQTYKHDTEQLTNLQNIVNHAQTKTRWQSKKENKNTKTYTQRESPEKNIHANDYQKYKTLHTHTQTQT